MGCMRGAGVGVGVGSITRGVTVNCLQLTPGICSRLNCLFPVLLSHSQMSAYAADAERVSNDARVARTTGFMKLESKAPSISYPYFLTIGRWCVAAYCVTLV